MKFALLVFVVTGASLHAAPWDHRTPFEKATQAKEHFPREILAQLTLSSFGLRPVGDGFAIVVTVPDQDAFDHAAKQLPREYHGIPIQLDILPYAEFQTPPASRDQAMQAGLRIKAETDGWAVKLRPTMVGVSKCNARTGDSNDGVRGVETVPCVSIYAPDEVARQTLHAHFGNRRDGVILIYKLSGPGPAVAYSASAPTLEEVRRVKEAMRDAVVADFSLAGIGIGSRDDAYVIVLTAPDEDVAGQLLARYPAGTLIEGVRVEVEMIGPIRAQQAAAPAACESRFARFTRAVRETLTLRN